MNHDASSDSLQPRLEFVTCLSPAGLHRMAYWEWGIRPTTTCWSARTD